MISGIFDKTKPINYLLILGFTFIFYWFVQLFVEKNDYDLQQTAVQSLILFMLLLSILVINFVVNRNQITNANSFVILYFALLLIIFPKAITDNNAILCNFFLLLACRRLISLKSLKNIKLKILDATLWVLTASLFYDWAALFLLLVFIAIYIYEPKNINNWLVPVVGVVVFVLISFAVLILANNADFFERHYEFSAGRNSFSMPDMESWLKLLIFVILIIITGMAVFLKSGKLGLGRIINLRIIAIYFAISLLVGFLQSSHENFPVLLCFFPGAVFMGKYVEIIKRQKIKELVLLGSILLSIIILLIDVLIK